MWFKRTPKNRRLERGHVLDVKLRTKEVRAARLKLATTALGVSLGTVIALYLLWRGGVWALDEFVFKNDAFIQGTQLSDAINGAEMWPRMKDESGCLAKDRLCIGHHPIHLHHEFSFIFAISCAHYTTMHNRAHLFLLVGWQSD